MPLTSHQLLARLAMGRTKEMIATEFDVSEEAIQRGIDTQVKVMGCRTSEQAVAQFVAARIKESLPITVRSEVDRVMAKRLGHRR